MLNQSTLYSLLFIRKFEEALLELFQKGEINGTTHTCIGQEEIPVAIMPLLQDEDFIFSNHRGHGHYLALFNDAEGLLAEIMGRQGSVCNGVGGSQHIKRKNYFSTGIQGASVPVATGVALELKRRNNKGIAISFIGDGTWGQGAVYEALNMASLWQLPVVIICENNNISQTTSSHLNMSGSIKSRAHAFNIDHYYCEETLDVDGIREIANKAFEKARQNQTPAVIEIITRRLASHSKGDDTRPAEQVLELASKDWSHRLQIKNPIEFKEVEKIVSSEIAQIVSKVIKRPLVELLDYPSISSPTSLFDNTNQINENVLNNLNRGMHILMKDISVYIVGEDILDPYGGAFKVTKGLSTKYPERVISTPISELGIAGIGNGLALTGQKAIVEFMFSDFVFLASDQIINFAAKTVTMYGEKLNHSILFRCPVGGNRGYGATHSQTVQKFFIGVPNLDLYELSPLHDCVQLLPIIMENGIPSMLFECKTLYAKDRILYGNVGDLFYHKQIDIFTSHLFIDSKVDIVLITGGGLVYECLEVAKKLYLEYEISIHIINPFKIYPLNHESYENLIRESGFVFTVEEGTEGGNWGSEISRVLTQNITDINLKIISLFSNDSIIPSSRNLESKVLINTSKIIEQILKNFNKWKK
jgi:2-oxoisovalerate dehydrogenase E1 component